MLDFIKKLFSRGQNDLPEIPVPVVEEQTNEPIVLDDLPDEQSTIEAMPDAEAPGLSDIDASLVDLPPIAAPPTEDDEGRNFPTHDPLPIYLGDGLEGQIDGSGATVAHGRESPEGAELLAEGGTALSWGKATAAWSSGSSNTLTLDPCTAPPDGTDIAGADNVTGYVVTPTDGDPAHVVIAKDDIVGYLPFGDNKGLVITVNGLPEIPNRAKEHLLHYDGANGAVWLTANATPDHLLRSTSGAIGWLAANAANQYLLYSSSGGIAWLAVPTSGTHVLVASGGSVSWVETEAFVCP